MISGRQREVLESCLIRNLKSFVGDLVRINESSGSTKLQIVLAAIESGGVKVDTLIKFFKERVYPYKSMIESRDVKFISSVELPMDIDVKSYIPHTPENIDMFWKYMDIFVKIASKF